MGAMKVVLFFFFIQLVSFQVQSEVTEPRTLGPTVEAQAAPPMENTLEQPLLNSTIRPQLSGKDRCRLQLVLFNLGRQALNESSWPLYRSSWLNDPGFEWAINKPRIYNHIETILTCRETPTSPSILSSYNLIPGAAPSVTFKTPNQHREFSSAEAERAYFSQILQENRNRLQNHGFEWVNSDQPNCGMPPQQERARDPMIRFPPCDFKARQ